MKTASSFLSILAFARAAACLDVPAYRIESVEVSVPNDVKSCFDTAAHLFSNVLRLEGFAEGLPLGKTARSETGQRAGFDAATVRLRWLDPGALLWVTWCTFPRGQGAYAKEGHSVLRVAEHRFEEIFRDTIYGSGSGPDGGTECHLAVTYEADGKLLTVEHTRKNWARGEDLQVDEGHGETVQSLWRYHLENAGLRFLGGERLADLLDERPSSEPGIGIAVPVAQLHRLNPGLVGKSVLRGHVRIDDRLGPYENEKNDRICD